MNETNNIETTINSDKHYEKELVNTGKGSKFSDLQSNYKFTTHELLIASVLAVMGGFISGLVPFSLLIKTWYPFVGGTQLVSAHHILWATLAYCLTKKKLIILLTSLFQGTVVFLLGSHWGVFEIVIQLFEGSCVLIGFYIVEFLKEGDTLLGHGIAGGIGNFPQVILFWVMTGKIYILHWALFVLSILFAFLSGFLIAGVLSKKITERIEKANLL